MKKTDLAVVAIVPLLVFLAVFFLGLRISYLESLILVLAIPGIYLSLKNKEKVRKVAWFTLLVSVPIAVVIEIVAFGDNGWSVPNSVFPWRLFGFMPLEDYIWMFLVTYIILIFYEHSCSRKFDSGISGKIKNMNWALYSLMGLVIILFYSNNSLLKVSYSFLWLGSVFFLIPTLLFLAKYPDFTASFFWTQAFFFYVHLIFKLIGLKLNHWIYPGIHYAGWISFFDLKFPVEEFFFVIVIGAFAACSYYEFFTSKRLETRREP